MVGSHQTLNGAQTDSTASSGSTTVGSSQSTLNTNGDGNPLREPPTPAERDALLAAYYRPHHQALTDAVSAALRECGRCLIIDCHSFPTQPLPYEIDQDPHRPDICIGTDAFHSPPAIVESLVADFARSGYNVTLNRPFAGALVPSLFYRKNPNVHSVMIEVNRVRYMDEASGAKLHRFNEVREALTQALKMIL